VYGSLRGIVTGRLDQRILIEVDAVGYWVHTGSWQPVGEVTTYLHHHVREDADQLFGFPDIQTLALFEKLLTVSGIGPKAALALLSLGSPERIRSAIQSADHAFLSMAPGIGKRAAEKVTLELKGKLPETMEDGSAPVASITDELLEALESLGYKRGDLLSTVREMPATAVTLDEQIKWVLKQMVR
jgi:Holliday junction DNA helicase RuvA